MSKRWLLFWGIVILVAITGILYEYNRQGPSSSSDLFSGHTVHTIANRNTAQTIPLENYLKTDFPPADGFDFPIGNPDGKGSYIDKRTRKKHKGWYIASHFLEENSLGIHPGEDWNGRGGGNTDLGQPVYATANGKVVFAQSCGNLWGNVVVVQHVYYENHEKKYIRSVYVHLEKINVKKGRIVRRRQKIGTIGRDPEKRYFAHLHFELRFNMHIDPDFWPSSNEKSADWVKRNYAAPSKFIQSHRKLFVPQKETTLILVDQRQYKLLLYKKGKLNGRYDISFGQSKGRKRRKGDNKTPKGMYFVIHHYRGQFGGPYGKYYGGHWIKINYPNPYDAKWGKKQNLISAKQESEIYHRWRRRQSTVESTPLGGGIGFHGWIREWTNNGPRHLSWGCIVMHNRDISRLYDQIPVGAMVVIR